MLLSPKDRRSRQGLGKGYGIDQREKAGQNSGSIEFTGPKPPLGGVGRPSRECCIRKLALCPGEPQRPFSLLLRAPPPHLPHAVPFMFRNLPAMPGPPPPPAPRCQASQQCRPTLARGSEGECWPLPEPATIRYLFLVSWARPALMEWGRVPSMASVPLASLLRGQQFASVLFILHISLLPFAACSTLMVFDRETIVECF